MRIKLSGAALEQSGIACERLSGLASPSSAKILSLRAEACKPCTNETNASRNKPSVSICCLRIYQFERMRTKGCSERGIGPSKPVFYWERSCVSFFFHDVDVSISTLNNDSSQHEYLMNHPATRPPISSHQFSNGLQRNLVGAAIAI